MSDQTAALLYNATVTSSAISAAFDLGLFDYMSNHDKKIPIEAFCNEKEIDLGSFHSLLYALACFDIVKIDGQIAEAGPSFDEINRNKGYFHWMVKGYDEFLADMPRLLNHENRKGSFFRRDGAAIARSGRDYGKHFVDSHVSTLLDALPFGKMADLGCGSAARLLDIVTRKGCSGVGIEIDSGGVQVARDAVEKARMADTVKVVQGDVSQLQPNELFTDVELISSFFMGHDLWPKERCVEIFRHFLKVFPKVRYFLFCDTYRSDLAPQREVPIFTLGFEVFHAFMGQYIPSRQEWHEVFNSSGWKCVKEVETDIPFTNIFLLTPDI